MDHAALERALKELGPLYVQPLKLSNGTVRGHEWTCRWCQDGGGSTAWTERNAAASAQVHFERKHPEGMPPGHEVEANA